MADIETSGIKVCVIGGGPAGMTAAYFAALGGADTVLLERNEKLGKKLYITGKGRCNLTNNVQPAEFIPNIVTNGKFCFGAINRFAPRDTIELIERAGVKLKTERGNRVFPVSDKSSDIISAFTRLLNEQGVTVRLNTAVMGVVYKEGRFEIRSDKFTGDFDRVVIACGGISYPVTGSTGDGYRFSERLGHTIVTPKASLCPIILNEDIRRLEGLSLKNVVLSFFGSNYNYTSEIGEMLFTDSGISGPLALTVSAYINKAPEGDICIDLKPALTHEELDKRVLRDFSEYINKDLVNALDKLLPKRLISDIIEKSGIPADKKVNLITVKERESLVNTLKGLRYHIKGLDSIDRAVVTAGGINTAEINPKTMESKIIKNLFFAGEVIDIDALTGGFNIQLALSTGYLAGTACGSGG